MINAGGMINKGTYIVSTPDLFMSAKTKSRDSSFDIEDGLSKASESKDEDPAKMLRNFMKTGGTERSRTKKSVSSSGFLSLIGNMKMGVAICFTAAFLGAFAPVVSSAQHPQNTQDPQKIEMVAHNAGTNTTEDIALAASHRESAAARSGSVLADYAKSWTGKNYKAGQTKRCADFVSTCIEKSNVAPSNFRHQTSAFQLQMYGKPIKKQDLRPGDLVFFKNTYAKRDFTHVGIYVGNGEFVHRPTFNSPVETETIDSGYFASHFSCGRRLELKTDELMDNMKPMYASSIPNPAVPQVILMSR